MLAAAGLAFACRGAAREPLVTYFNGDHGLSLRHPASWRGDQREQDGMWYRYFQAPPKGTEKRSPLSLTLLAGKAALSIDEYAARYLEGNEAEAARNEERQGISGKSWSFRSKDGATRHRLLLLVNQGHVAGLHAQGDSDAFAASSAILDEVWSSFTVERPDRYPLHAWPKAQASLGVPPSWRKTREFSGNGTTLVQFASPALGVDRRETVHAALSLTLEDAPEGGLEAYYQATRRKLGDNYPVASHNTFKDGYVDVMRTETPLAVSFIRRYYFVNGGRACSLSFEAREDVFPRAARWADYVASTLRLGPEAAAKR